MQTIVLQGQKIKLSPNAIKGVGGEATVVQHQNLAIKIFHQPTAERAEKLVDFLKLRPLPNSVCSPVDVVQNIKGQIIGYSMNLLPDAFSVVQSLASRKFRESHPDITSAVIVNMFLDAYATNASLHAKGIVIGDQNDLNALFRCRQRAEMAFIDADSFQFSKYPCMVGTEHFLDPNLYNLNLADQPYFKPENDWYAWFVMFIRSLLMVHPYGGTHRKLPLLTQRAQARVTFLDNDVKYPKSALHPDLLNDSLKSLFDRMFHKGERFVPPLEAFADYRDSLLPCHSCGVMFPSECPTCPQCSKVNVQQVQRPVKVVSSPTKRAVHCNTLLSTPGKFIWRHCAGLNVYAVALEDKQYILYIYTANANTRSIPLPISHRPKFDFWHDNLVMSNPANNQILLFDLASQTIKDGGFADTFQGSMVFSCGRDFVFRVYQGFLFLRGENYERNVNAVARNQTWISSSPNHNILFGIQRFFNLMKFFVYSLEKQKTHLWYPPIEIEFLEDESIIDVSVRISGSNILLLLKTEIRGKTFTHTFIIHQDKIQYHAKVEAIGSDTYRIIHGKAFVVPPGLIGVVLHATDEGVVQEIINSTGSSMVLLKETEPYVAENDSIDHYGDGILVTTSNQIHYLTMS
ncbi:MAG: hypothetical protein WC341_12900 [Bacteroidales bacterium]|jgi:hypothetical protein